MISYLGLNLPNLDHSVSYILTTDGYRIPCRRGADPPGAPTYNSAEFSKKMHEIEKFLAVDGTPPRSDNTDSLQNNDPWSASSLSGITA